MPDNNAVIFIYIPCRDAQQAQDIGHALVVQKLVACANIFPAMQSIYRWQGKVQSENEALLIVKTTAEQFKAVEVTVNTLHSYEKPCIAALNVADVNDAYREWILSQIEP